MCNGADLKPKIAPATSFDDDEFEAAQYRRMNAEEAQLLRSQMPSVTPWQVVKLQALAGLAAALLAWGLTQRSSAGWSAAYGALTVLIPAVLFARGLARQFARTARVQPASAAVNLLNAGVAVFMWEAVKIIITLVMLFAASRLVENLEWLALLAGLVVTLKVYWLALLVRPRRKLGATLAKS